MSTYLCICINVNETEKVCICVYEIENDNKKKKERETFIIFNGRVYVINFIYFIFIFNFRVPGYVIFSIFH